MLRSLAAPLALVAAVTLAAPAHSEPTFGPQSTATAVFAGGCFWGIEGVFEHVKGVMSATAGYAGGSVASPTYEQVSSGTTGHAEAVRVTYDPAQITYEQLLEVFFTVAHDPTQLNRQGPDHGTQYRSVVFYNDTAQQRVVQDYVGELMRKGIVSKPVVTQIVPLTTFYEAEEHHQNYMARHPRAMYIVYNDAPKVANLTRQVPALYREPIP